MDNNENIEGFINILNEQYKSSAEKVNMTLYNDICQTAEIIDKTDNDPERKVIKENLRERFKNVDLNQVTDVFIFNQRFFTTNENPVPTPSALCINIGQLFTNQNLHYIATKVYSSDELEGSCALSFLGYLALLQNEGTYIHRDYVLNFIQENFEGFSQNNKTECVFQLKNYLSDDEIAQQIINDSGITEYKLTFSTKKDSTSRPITFKLSNNENGKNENSVEEPGKQKKDSIENTNTGATEVKKEKLPWWQFWK